MMMKNKFVICSVCIIILTACIVSTGCTSTSPQGAAQTSAQTNPPTITTLGQTLIPTTAPVTITTTMAPTTASIAIISTPATPISSGLTVTLNSAVKKTTLGSSTPKTGLVFLVLDVTIQNNDKNNDFKYTDSSFSIYDIINKKRDSAMTSKVAGGLNTPLTSGTIPLKSTKTGQIVFGVSDSSNSYKFAVVNSTTALIPLIDINVP
jgi:hypothetical protein